MKILSLSTLIGTLMLVQLPAQAAECTNMSKLAVPGAQHQVIDCLDDLSTKYLIAMRRTDASDWGTLHSQQTRNPAGAIPGIQIDGYFPDTSTFNTTYTWSHG